MLHDTPNVTMRPATERLHHLGDIVRPLLAYAGAATLALILSGCNGLPWRDQPPGEDQTLSGLATHREEPARPAPNPAPAKPAPTRAPSVSEQPAKTATASTGTTTVPPGPASVWERLRDQLVLPIPDNPRVEREWQWYADHPDYLARVQERARPYLHYILNEAQERGLPGELALLPVVESAYQPFAYSPGQASGIWQFIPSTGRHFGLRQTWWYDGRRDIMASTRAALDYLAQLNGELDGDWELALAAYNTGSGNVRRAIRRNQRHGRPTDFWSLDLPRETEGYVPRLLAISRLIADPAAAGIELADIPDTAYFTPVATGGQVDLAMAADMAGLPMDDLYRLNPGYNRWATDPDGPHRLLVPIECAAPLEQGLAQLGPEQRVRWERYRIAKGDNLIGIAHRHHTTVEVLRQANGIKGSRITAGKHLLIPVAARIPGHYVQSADQRLARAQRVPHGKQKIDYLVQPGDTLWDIARTHGVGFRELARWNAMSPVDTLRPGQQLVVWQQQAGSNALKPSGTHSTLRYSVRRGDSLYKISRRFKVSIADLRHWNDLAGKKYLRPGQKLKVLVDVTEQSAPL